ncbi:MAG TPA: lytic transglycosylase domain-containing protein [Rhizomicrobium sp.]|nr:lytic transglycosylase domain-containing protein [Rhizomicrobium sp.]
MRIALALGFTVALGGAAFGQTSVSQAAMNNSASPAENGVTVPAAAAAVPAIAPVQPANPQVPVIAAPAAPPVKPSILSDADSALYRQAFAAARGGQLARARALVAHAGDPMLAGYVEAAGILETRHPALNTLVNWLNRYRELSVADRIYRLAVSRSTKKVRRGRKLITVAVVTNIPAPVSVGRRTGGYEDAELPEPSPGAEPARALLTKILADIKAGAPDRAMNRLTALQAAGTCSPDDVAVLSHRIALSYLAEGMDAQALQLSGAISSASVPQLDWDAGFAAYRMGRYADAIPHLERLAENNAAQGQLRAQAAFWAARAHMQLGDPQKVVSLLTAAAKEEPTFYGLIAERMLGMDTSTGFSDAVLSQKDFNVLMASPPARRAVALYQAGETDFAGPELNHAFVDNAETLDPAMAALARDIGVTNVELRASEKSVARGLLLTGLFPVPPYAPKDGYRVDSSLVLAFARIESRFQNGATSPVGAQGIMQFMPKTATLVGGRGAEKQLYDPSYSLSLGQRYIAELLDQLNGNLLEIGGAYNAGPQAVNRWLTTKAGKDDPLLFVESIPVAETRYYVKHLMEYHWMYRRRLGQDAKSLDETARGAWPIYRPATPAAPALPATAPGDDSAFSDISFSKLGDDAGGNPQSVQ